MAKKYISKYTGPEIDSGLDNIPKLEGKLTELESKVEKKNSEIVNIFGDYISNEEFIRAYTDADGKFLWGIRNDGSIDWALGVPKPIKNFVEKYIADLDRENDAEVERINQIVIDLVERVKNIESNLFVISNEEWLYAIVDAENKVLFGINAATGNPHFPNREMYNVISDEQWLYAIVDAENKVLVGVQKDGSVEWGKGVPMPIKNYIDSRDNNNDAELDRLNEKIAALANSVKTLIDTYYSISNEEWAMAILDAQNKILMGIRNDGSYYVPNRDFYHVESTEEYLKVVLDADNKVVFGIRNNGSVYIPKGMSRDAEKAVENLTIKIEENKSSIAGLINYLQFLSFEDNPEYVNVVTDADGKVLEGITKDGKKFLPTQEHFDKYNDVEGRTELTLDAENKVIGYRDGKGVRHEKEMHIEVAKTKRVIAETISADNLALTDDNASQIEAALNNINYLPKLPIAPNDFSNDEVIELPIPRVAASVRLLVPKMPTSKTADIEGFLEYYDKDGNYFKKAIILNSQGTSSMSYVKPNGMQGNLGVDFTDCEIKFGSWVSQDSFHIKKYYIDAFRGQCVVAYRLMEQIYQTHPFGEKKPYDTIIQNDSVTDSLGKFKKDFNTGALCHPDGFPVVIYVNTGGEDILYGVYAWCLKKHRDNYYCAKDNADNIILDGVIDAVTIFNGNVDWSEFEIRNPKDLVDIDGNEYDGDNPKELSDTDSLSAATKSNIERLSEAMAIIKANKTKEVFEQFFLPKYMIDYFLISQVLYHADGFRKNWIWCTWDGQHWTPTLYDADSVFGMDSFGTFIKSNSDSTNILSSGPTDALLDLYKEEIDERYKELREKGVFSVGNIVGLLDSWINSIGYDNLKNDLDLCNETPSYRNGHISDMWEIVSYAWGSHADDYDDTKVYAEGETCYYLGYQMRAKRETQGNEPFMERYDSAPIAGGFYNSLSRVNNWLKNRIAFLDSYFNY